MFYDSSAGDIDFPSYEPYYKSEKVPEQKRFNKKNCIIIIAIISVLIILIVGIFLAVYFGSKKKESGGIIKASYYFPKVNKSYALFNLIGFTGDDYEEPSYNDNYPFRLLKDENQKLKPEDQCNNGTCYIEIKFNKVITSLEGMFANMTELITVDFSQFNSKKIINMNNLFSNCTNLEKVTFEEFNAKNLETIDNMFENCPKLSKIDLKSYSTPKLYTMNSAFKGCTNLISLDISNFILNSKIDYGNAFQGCDHLKIFNHPAKNYESIKKEYDKTIINGRFCEEGINCQKCEKIDDKYPDVTICKECVSTQFFSNNIELPLNCSNCMAHCLQCNSTDSCIECDDDISYPKNEYNKNICIPYNFSSTDILDSIDTTNIELPTSLPTDI